MKSRTAVEFGTLVLAVVLIGLSLDSVIGFARGVRSWYSRHRLFAALRPVHLTNCSWARVGNANDGGYLMCHNLLVPAGSAYSYGIDGRDEWGCAISQRLSVPVHEYDCYVTVRPTCPGATFIFHEECVGSTGTDSRNRRFETLPNQVATNGDTGKPIVVKMDIEGAEWDVLLSTPDSVFGHVQQLVVEFHGTDEGRYVEAIEKLKRTFVVANVHFNNLACDKNLSPFPAWAYEVLFVNRTVARWDNAHVRRTSTSALDAPNTERLPDCQAEW
jgi:hypothetical protein